MNDQELAEYQKQVAEEEEEYVFLFLDDLRESGITNMMGSTPYIQREFGIDKREAKAHLLKWMKTYSTRHPA